MTGPERSNSRMPAEVLQRLLRDDDRTRARTRARAHRRLTRRYGGKIAPAKVTQVPTFHERNPEHPGWTLCGIRITAPGVEKPGGVHVRNGSPTCKRCNRSVARASTHNQPGGCR